MIVDLSSSLITMGCSHYGPYTLFDCVCMLKGSNILRGSSVNKIFVTVPEDMAAISHTHLPIKAAISSFLDTSDQVPLILPKMQDQKSSTLH